MSAFPKLRKWKLAFRTFKAVALFVGALQSDAVVYGQFHKFDRSVLEELTEDRTRKGVELNRWLSHSTNYISLLVPASVAIAGVIGHQKDMEHTALYIAESIAVSSVVTTCTKMIVRRPRPFVSDPSIIPDDKAGSYSFPSGHASESFSTATSLAIAYPKWYVIAPAYLWAGSVAYSRMYLGVHYPSDIAAGAVMGAASAWLMYKVNRRLQRQSVYFKKARVPNTGSGFFSTW